MEDQLERCSKELWDILTQGNFKTTRLDIRLNNTINKSSPLNNVDYFSNFLTKLTNNLRFTIFSNHIYKLIACIEQSHVRKAKWHCHLQVFWHSDIDCDKWSIKLKEYIEYLALDEKDRKEEEVLSNLNCYINFDSFTGIGEVDIDNCLGVNKTLLCLRYLCKYRLNFRRANKLSQLADKKGYLTNVDLYGIEARLFRCYDIGKESNKVFKLPIVVNKKIIEGIDKVERYLNKLRIEKGISGKECTFYEHLEVCQDWDNVFWWDTVNYREGWKKKDYIVKKDWLKRLGISEIHTNSIKTLLRRCDYDFVLFNLNTLLRKDIFELVSDEENDLSLQEYENEDYKLALEEIDFVVKDIGIEKVFTTDLKEEIKKLNTNWITENIEDILNIKYFEKMDKRDSDMLIEHIKEINSDPENDDCLDEWCFDYFLDRWFLGSSTYFAILFTMALDDIKYSISEKIHCYLSRDRAGDYYIDYSKTLLYSNGDISRAICYYYTCIRLDLSIVKKIDILN